MSDRQITVIRQRVALFLLGAATIWLSANVTFILSSALAGQFSPAPLIDLGRTYLFRNAVKNSLLVAACAASLMLPLQWLIQQIMGGHNLHVRSAWLLPLWLPTAMTALLWRTVWTPWIFGQAAPWVTLVFMSIAAAWLATPLTLLSNVSGRKWGSPLALLLAAYIALSDVVTPLLLTGGQPFSATYTLAGWTYQQIAVNQALVTGATAALVWVLLMSPLVGLFVWAAAHARHSAPSRPKGQETRAISRGGFRVSTGFLLGWAWLPLGLALLRGARQGIDGAPWQTSVGLLFPLGATVLGAAVIGSVATWVSAGVAKTLVAWRTHRKIGACLLALTMLVWPVAFVAVAAAPWARLGVFSVNALALGIVGGAGLTLLYPQANPRSRRAAVFLFAALLFWHDYASVTFLPALLRGVAFSDAALLQLGAPAAGVNGTLLMGALLLGAMGIGVWTLLRPERQSNERRIEDEK